MSPSIAVFGTGPGLGRAVARRYAREGWTVVLVARHREPLDLLAKELPDAHVITADLADTAAIPALAQRIRAEVGDLDAFYYGVSAGGFVPAVELTREHVEKFLPLALYGLQALVHEFLPAMIERGSGAILSAQGASATHGIPNMSGPGPTLAAQRNYLQSLEGELGEKNVYIGRLYIGAAIEGSAWHTWLLETKAAGKPVPDATIVDPADLADLLWTMHSKKTESEARYPEAAVWR